MQHGHLARLERTWIEQPVLFVTTCTHQRRRVLAAPAMHAICREVWETGERLHRWLVGRYVIMPDHVHFFCAAREDNHRLQTFVGKWKEWTSKFAHRRLGIAPPLWQPEFFDHVLRSSESYEEQWLYACDNPFRAGLVQDRADWPFQGELHDLRYK